MIDLMLEYVGNNALHIEDGKPKHASQVVLYFALDSHAVVALCVLLAAERVGQTLLAKATRIRSLEDFWVANQ